MQFHLIQFPMISVKCNWFNAATKSEGIQEMKINKHTTACRQMQNNIQQFKSSIYTYKHYFKFQAA